MNFGKEIINWYIENQRELPWRINPHPYSTWLSEVILQQTRVAQGLPYYIKFINTYPEVKDLANAPQEEVLKLWQGLGYYSRARNMHFTAQEVMRLYAGKFPSSYEQLIQLKGIGEYTAAAIASICSEQKVAVIDGNVYRVLARYFNLNKPIDTTNGKRIFKELANELITSPTSHYNQGLMELGALICTPKKAQCLNCPLQITCEGYANQTVYDLPVKSKKTKVRDRFFDYFILIDNERNILLRKRSSGDIWEGLYDFPILEKKKFIDTIIWPQELNNLFDSAQHTHLSSPIVTTHILSHQKLTVRFIPFHLNTSFTTNELVSACYTLTPSSEINAFPVPQLVHNFLEKHFENLLPL
jgi:A/G-specific adenine glycosylase